MNIFKKVFSRKKTSVLPVKYTPPHPIEFNSIDSIFGWLIMGMVVYYALSPGGKEFLLWYKNYRPVRKRSHLFFWG